MKQGIWETDRRRAQTEAGGQEPDPPSQCFGATGGKTLNSAANWIAQARPLSGPGSLKLHSPFQPIPALATGYTPIVQMHGQGRQCFNSKGQSFGRKPLSINFHRARWRRIVEGGGSLSARCRQHVFRPALKARDGIWGIAAAMTYLDRLAAETAVLPGFRVFRLWT